MNDNVTSKTPNEAFAKTRDYFLGNSLTPSENVPDLLAENRRIAVSLAESVMSIMDVIANYFGVPTMELAMEALPEISLQPSHQIHDAKLIYFSQRKIKLRGYRNDQPHRHQHP